MIYTVTFNPSLDYLLYLPHLELGQVCRADREIIFPGGKGINVSIMLTTLGVENIALGFTAGFTGDMLTQMLEEHLWSADFIALPQGSTRINVKLKAQTESDINGHGPDIPEAALADLLGKLDQLQEGDVLVLAGSIPSTLPQSSYEQILDQLSDRGILFVVDATKDLLKNVLSRRPFLIKPNIHELGEMLGLHLHTTADVKDAARQVQALGARNVLVSMGGDGAVLLDEGGRYHETLPPPGTPVNSVGAGDSMVAGFLAGWFATNCYEEAFKLGVAAGSASTYQEWLAGKDQVLALLTQLP